MPDKPKYYQDYNELVELMKKSDHNYNFELIDKAYRLAEKMHGDQRRASGIPYILHPTTVACILAELGMDSESIAAALLHDVVEDTPVTLEEITKQFGSEIAGLIDGVTKLGKIPYSSREEQQAENIRKMLIAMSNDIRVIIIKLADRLHNMRTIECMKEQHRRDKALEVMEVYAPIAHRLGIRAIKEELEDLSIRYLDPVGYSEIEKQLELKSKDRLHFVADIKQVLYDRLKDEISNVYIEGRVKSIHGIYKKTFMKGRTMDQIYDIFAVRVIVDSVADCYNVLGVVHDLFKPLPNRFKDYISTPKPNMYQSLHTTVIGKEGIPFEIQIRTWEMHYTAEYGIAAHWKYKEGVTKKDSLDERLAWIRKMLENQNDNDSTDIVRTIKMDLVPEEVFVFTPKGDVINLPTGATVIDVAYAIHSEVGNRMIGAKVDKRIVSIDYKVKTGEIVEIITTKESGGPKRDWLNIVRTSEARSKIRLWFKREKRDENIQEGKAQLEAEFRRLNINVPEKEWPEFLADVIHKQNCNTIEDFYASIGYGGIQLWRILPRIKEDYFKKYSETEPAPIIIKEPAPKTKVSSGVHIEGIDDCLVKYSKCCNPLPGDDIIGFITRGYGVSIHKRNCTNVPKDIRTASEPERWVSAEWADNIADETFQATLQISATDRTGLLADITNQLSALHIFIHSLNSRETKNGVAIIEISVTVNGINHLKSVISRLSGINGIVSIGRN
ncbi:MAG: bifunctional (p)ppGpp synthetase/guanosine-3',5'-bis(diphosphate) 3'-pyrophosphohydrolase [Clostridia bacterium]|nr:bifunctional (p)ppGpp synthetase/guanosine-3',5'-bis(diphosphate) 3'-pyrophosphohydrolase [Clostridia bacterium]